MLMPFVAVRVGGPIQLPVSTGEGNQAVAGGHLAAHQLSSADATRRSLLLRVVPCELIQKVVRLGCGLGVRGDGWCSESYW